MHRSLLALVFTFGLLAPASSLVAQVSSPVIRPAEGDKVQRVLLRDGSELVGRITAVGDSTVQFQSSLGTTTIPIASIVKVTDEEAGEFREGRYYFPNPNDTRLIFAPTGRQLSAGKGYFSDYWVFFPGIAVGMTDRITIGGGLSIFPEVGLDDQVYYITPKVGVIQRERLNVAVGALAATVPGDNDNNTAGILYGVSTWGRPNASFTAGLGYGFVNDRLADSPVLMVGGEARASPRISFVTENYLFPGNNSAISGGIRFLGRNISVDLALANLNSDGENFCCLPFLGFVWKWD